MEIQVVQKLMKVNDEIASGIRKQFQESNTCAINFMGSPGAGKTSVLEQLLQHLKEKVKIGVIGGDPETNLDAERMAPLGVPVTQIQTSGTCHLEANLLVKALENFSLSDIEYLFIENVGNLLCPASFDIGTKLDVVVISTPEGQDKVLKYPNMFRRADAILLNKIDLLPHLPFDVEKFHESVNQINPEAQLFEITCMDGTGIPEFASWLTQRRE